MQTSDKGRAFIQGHEGVVLKAYKCPAGVWTIGAGLTAGTGVVKPHKGMTITRKEADRLFALALERKYEPPVNRALPNVKQHQFDGSTSMTWNCGPGALGWKWAKALARGDVSEAARRLRNTATTANGRRLAGLVRRRKEEAALIEDANYGGHMGAGAPGARLSVSLTPEAIKEYQGQLKTLGYYDGERDGLAGPRTRKAVREFQADNDLTVDGIVGPATRAALIRALDARNTKTASGGAGAAGGAAGGGAEVATAPEPTMALDGLLSALGWGIGIAVVVFIAFMIFRYRGRLTGKRVPT